jgi:hypothetical protein
MIEGKGKPLTIGKDVESALENLIYSDTMYDLSRFFFFRANQISGFFKDMIPPTLMAQLLDTTYLSMWEPFSSTECLQPKEDTNYDPVLTNEKCQMGQDEFRQMMLLSTSESVSNKDKEKKTKLQMEDADGGRRYGPS